MATGQQGFDPDDFVRRDREQDERRREQERIDSMRRSQERLERDEAMQRRDEMSSMRKMMDIINDSNIQVDQDMVKAINDPMVVMTNDGQLARLTGRRSSIAGQFRRDRILPRTSKKTKRRKNPKLAAAFREANRRYRTKGGKLRKGRTQADIARLAHRLLKKM
jgi:hypothetical protein